MRRAASGDVNPSFSTTSIGSPEIDPAQMALNPAATLLYVTNSSASTGNFKVVNLDANGSPGTVNNVALPAILPAARSSLILQVPPRFVAHLFGLVRPLVVVL